jgi:adenylate cyclase
MIPGPRPLRGAAIAAVAVAALIGLLGAWFWFSDADDRITAARADHMAFALPNKPSVLVMPFEWHQQAGMGDFREQNADFAKNLSHNLITALSRLPGVFVMSNRTSLSFVQAEPTPAGVAAEMTGVRYVVTGSLEGQGKKLRNLVFKAALIDAVEGKFLWRDEIAVKSSQVRGAFYQDLSDQLLAAVLEHMKIDVAQNVLAHAKRRDIVDQQIWGFLHNSEQSWWNFDEDSNHRVVAQTKTWIKRHPKQPALLTHLGWGQWTKRAYGWTHGLPGSYKRMADAAKQALAASPDYPPAHSLHAIIQLWGGKTDNALASCEKARLLGPSDAEIAFDCGLALLLSGQYEEALAETRRGFRLYPQPAVFRRDVLAEIHRVMGNLEGMRKIDEQIIKQDVREWQTVPAHLRLLVSEVEAGNLAAAKSRLQWIKRIAQNYSFDIYRGRFKYTDTTVMEKFYAALESAQNTP